MYNPTKYPYINLNREEVNGSRKYCTPDGEKLPSVTTILDSTKPLEKVKALQEWRNRVGHKKAQEITTNAANRGTRMHTYLEYYVKNGEMKIKGTNPHGWLSYEMAQVVIDNGLTNCNEYWGTEINLYYPKVYAGTTDLVGIHNNVECIMDFKQTNKTKKKEYIDDYFLQLVAYSLAHNELYNTKINKGVIFMCSQNKEYQEFIIEGNEFNYWVNQWYKRLEEYYTKFL